MRERKSFENITPGPLKDPPVAPKDLDNVGKKAWDTGARYLVDRGLLHSGDLPALRAWARAIAFIERMEKELQDAQLVVEYENNIKPDPRVSMLQRAHSNAKAWAQTLCLAPAARTRLSKEKQEPTPTTEKTEWAGVIDIRGKGR